jgi:hypothetical protein
MAKGKDAPKKKGQDAGVISVASHPRAARAVRKAKGYGGLGGFVLAVVLSVRAGVPFPDAALRGIEAGLGGYLALWFATVMVWRQLAVAEIEAARRHLLGVAEREIARKAADGGGA